MIDPKSLRIGNYVRNSDWIWSPDETNIIKEIYGAHVVTEIKSPSVTEFSASKRAEISHISGIPLSEQELIRLGFVYKEGSEHGFNEWAYPGKYNFQIGEFNGEGYLIDAYDSMPPMRYVHQLQNLFQILTGEELTYKVDSGLTPTEPDTKETAVEKIDALRKLIGPTWDNVTCVCRELMKDDACSCNCKEFHDESLPNKKEPVIGSNGITDPPFKTEEA